MGKDTQYRERRQTGTLLRHGRNWTWLLILSAVVLIAATAWYYFRQSAAMETAAMRELATIADMNATQIANWRSERLADGHIMQSSAIVRIAKRVLAAPTPEPSDTADLQNTIAAFQRQFLYGAATLVDTRGSIRLASNLNGADVSWISQVGKAASNRSNPALENLHWDAKLAHPMMALAAPVPGSGALVF